MAGDLDLFSLDDFNSGFFGEDGKSSGSAPDGAKNKAKASKGRPKIVTIVSNVLFYAVIISVLTGATVFALSRNADKAFFGYRFYNVLTPSMAPVINKGDLVFVKVVPSSDIQKGDIITFNPS
ncbi:MAG: hypothetical protein FWF08_07115, partial [Oscillospiraceae bacterium]|nr:hypothetical protein [Oscillospiraceae bacterium]